MKSLGIRFGKSGIARIATACFIALSTVSWATIAAAEMWSADVLDVVDGKFVPGKWESIDNGKVTKAWRLCVLYPHLKDDYWLGHNYGIVEEAKRDNISVQVYEAGGYGNLATQLNQMDNCIVEGYDAILIAAISADGTSALVKKAVEKGIVVIDYSNGINEPTISGHARVPFYNMGRVAGEYLVKHPGEDKHRVVLLPGPEGAGFSDETVAGFNDAIKGSDVTISATPRGDLSVNQQLDLVQSALEADPDINYVVGLNTGADAAVVALRQAGRQKGEVPIFSMSVSPAVKNSLIKGEMTAAVTDFPVVTARMAVDMAVKLLEKQTLASTNSGPSPQVVEKSDAENEEFMKKVLAPEGFEPTFTVDAKR